MAASIIPVFVDLTSDDDHASIKGSSAVSSSTKSHLRLPLKNVSVNQKVPILSSKSSNKRISNQKPSQPPSKKLKSEAFIQDSSEEYSILSFDGITSGDNKEIPKPTHVPGITDDELNTVIAAIDAAIGADDQVEEEDVVLKIEEALEDDAIAKYTAKNADKDSLQKTGDKTRDEIIDALIKDIRTYTWKNLKIHKFTDQELDSLRIFAANAPISGPLPVVTMATDPYPSFGDTTIDDKHAEFVDVLEAEYNIKPESVIKYSGLLSDPLLLGWNYPPENHRDDQQYGLVADPSNACMRVAGMKLVGVERHTTEGLSHGIMMADYFSVRQEVPPRSKPDTSTIRSASESPKQPYETLPRELVRANALHYDRLCNQSQAIVQIHLGESNFDRFCRKHENDQAHFKFFSVSDTTLFRSQKHGCLEYLQGRSAIRRVHFFVHHTESQFHSIVLMKRAELLDKLWNAAAMITHHTKGNQTYYQWRSEQRMRTSDGALHGSLAYWEAFGEHRLRCLFEIRIWEKDNDMSLPLSETPAWMKVFEKEQGVSLTHTTRSLAGQILLVYCTRGNKTQADGGWEGLVRGRATAAANGHRGLVRGRAVVEARRAAGVTKQQIQVDLKTTLSTEAYDHRMAKNEKRMVKHRAKTGGKPKKQWSLEFIKNTLRIYDEEPFESWHALARRVGVPGSNRGTQVKRWVDSRAKYDAVSL